MLPLYQIPSIATSSFGLTLLRIVLAISKALIRSNSTAALAMKSREGDFCLPKEHNGLQFRWSEYTLDSAIANKLQQVLVLQ
jgi:hypothetical protein